MTTATPTFPGGRPPLRAVVLSLGGAFVCGAITVSFPLMAVLAETGVGPPVETRDLVGGLVFWSLAALVLVLIARAVLRRVRAVGELVWLARATAVLAVLGLGAGVWFGWTIRQGLAGSLLRDAQWRCEAFTTLGFDTRQRCETTGEQCIREGWRLPADRVDRAGALRDALFAKKQAADVAAATEARKTGFAEDAESRALASLLDALDAFKTSPKLRASQQAALVCLAQAGGLSF